MFCSIHKFKLCLTIVFSLIIVLCASEDKENIPYDPRISRGVGGAGAGGVGSGGGASGHSLEPRNSYAMLSQAMSHAVNHEFRKLIFLFFHRFQSAPIIYLYLFYKYSITYALNCIYLVPI